MLVWYWGQLVLVAQGVGVGLVLGPAVSCGQRCQEAGAAGDSGRGYKARWVVCGTWDKVTWSEGWVKLLDSWAGGWPVQWLGGLRGVYPCDSTCSQLGGYQGQLCVESVSTQQCDCTVVGKLVVTFVARGWIAVVGF